LPGANKTATDISQSLELTSFTTSWRPPVIVAISETGEGVDKIWQAVKDHHQFLSQSGQLNERRKQKVQAELGELVAEMARDNLKEVLESCKDTQELLDQIVERKVDPHSAAEKLARNLFGASIAKSKASRKK